MIYISDRYQLVLSTKTSAYVRVVGTFYHFITPKDLYRVLQHVACTGNTAQYVILTVVAGLI